MSDYTAFFFSQNPEGAGTRAVGDGGAAAAEE